MVTRPRTLRERLSASRRAAFVGRGDELAVFRDALASPESALLAVSGPGGVGKSALLRMFADDAEAAGARAVLLDGRDFAPSPGGFLAGLRAALGLADDAPVELGGRVVLLVDSYELLAPLDGWLREHLLPGLPADTLAVLAGRQPLPARWTADPGWRSLVRVIALGNLADADARRYLAHAGVPAALHDEVLGFSGGHPLALSLLADVLRHGRADAVRAAARSPDVVGELARRFAEDAPTPVHRQALHAAAIARITDEAVLRAALEIDDAHALFTWLRGLSFVDGDDAGVRPHDLVRDALNADLRLRDRRAPAALRYRIGGHLSRRVRAADGRHQGQLIQDLLYLFRSNPDSAPFWDWTTFGQTLAEPVAAADVPEVTAILRHHQGEDSAAIAGRWLDVQPEAFHLARDGDGRVRAVVGWLSLHDAPAEDIAADPGTRAVWDFVRAQGGLRPGEQVTFARFIADRELHQHASPAINLVSAEHIRQVISRPGLRWDFMTTVCPDYWAPLWTKIGYERAPAADFDVGGLSWAVYGHDWRHRPGFWHPALVGDRTAAPTLSEVDFAAAVKAGLRDFRRPDLLAASPLRGTRAARRRADGEPGAAQVRALLEAAAQSLREHPRDEKLFRAVDRTYLRPAATQERAAEVLGLPFSTYRRHLTEGVARIVAALWAQETAAD